MTTSQPDPVMLRSYAGGHTGATAFFRNRPFLDTLVETLAAAAPTGVVRVFCHACSLGAEPYSLALWWLHRQASAATLEITATDIEPEFMAVASRATYLPAVLEGMTPEERGWFEREGEGVRVPAEARQLVRFAPPMSFVDDGPDRQYDAVLIMNALTYVTPDQQHEAILKAARHARVVLGVTAFHPDTIRHDVEAAGFVPLERRRREIHAAWGDRLVDGPLDPRSPKYSWQLPREIPDFPDAAYRYSALFVPRAIAPTATADLR